MSLHIQFDFPFFGTIRTREQVQATLHFRVAPAVADHLKCSFGFKSEERLYNEIGRELHAKAQSATGRWALQFPSANAALDPSAYASLEASLRSIGSTQFTITSATVSNIVPVTPEPEPPRKEIPPPQPPSPEDEVRAEVMPILGRIKAVRKIESEIKETEPELAKDPHYGFASGTIPHPYNTAQRIPVQGYLKKKFDDLEGKILK